MKISSIESQVQDVGVLIGKPCVKIRFAADGHEMDVAEISKLLNSMVDTYIEFNDPAGHLENEREAEVKDLVDGLKKSAKFVTLVTNGRKHLNAIWDFITIAPRDGSDPSVIDGLLRLKTKIQVVFYVDGLNDLKGVQAFLSRHYLISKRKIPVVVMVSRREWLDQVLNWRFVKSYNHRLLVGENVE